MVNAEDFLGKKIFFLFPHAVVQNRIMEELIQQEFEVYTVKEPLPLRRVLKKHPNSLVFGNVYEGMSEKEWENWILGVMKDPVTQKTGIGLICSGEDDGLRDKYLNKVKINCGYTIVRADLLVTLKELFEILKTTDAKGRRKFIRAAMDRDSNAKINLPVRGNYINGIIKDISAAGFSCTLDEDHDLTRNSLFQDIQVRLGAAILKTEGIVFGSRNEGTEKVHVILFTQRVDPDSRAKIRTFIQSSLQIKLNEELKRGG